MSNKINFPNPSERGGIMNGVHVNLLKKDSGAWDFVENFYPDYYHAQEIADADDLQKLIDGEGDDDSTAYNILQSDYDGDWENPKILEDYNALHIDIYTDAIDNFLRLLREQNQPSEIPLANPSNDTTYFLFGTQPVEQYEENQNVEDIDTVNFDGAIYEHDCTARDHLQILISNSDGWGKYWEISKADFEYLKGSGVEPQTTI